jgi:ribosomal protein L19
MASVGVKHKEIVGGDSVWVRYRDKIGSVRYKNFRGVCLSSRKKGGESTIVVRNTIGGVGVEYGFHTSSKMIYDYKKISDKRKRGGRVKRYDLRKA